MEIEPFLQTIFKSCITHYRHMRAPKVLLVSPKDRAGGKGGEKREKQWNKIQTKERKKKREKERGT